MVNIQETNTIRSIRRWAINALNKSDIEDPDINAEVLLSHVLSCDRLKLHTNPENIIKDKDVIKYKELIKKRARHVPLQYITGHVEFMSLDFIVDKSVLIPRPETEILVETALKKVKNGVFPNNTITIVDIGTGSGNIAISLAVNLQNVQVYASDISKDALDIARINARRHDVAEKIRFLHGYLFEAFDGHLEKGSINLIVSNPPYVSESGLNNLEPEIKEHEPYEALIAGKDGLCFYKQIIKSASDWLKPKGCIILEAGETQAKAIIELIGKEGYFEDIEIIKDLQGKERIVSAKRK